MNAKKCSHDTQTQSRLTFYKKLDFLFWFSSRVGFTEVMSELVYWQSWLNCFFSSIGRKPNKTISLLLTLRHFKRDLNKLQNCFKKWFPEWASQKASRFMFCSTLNQLPVQALSKSFRFAYNLNSHLSSLAKNWSRDGIFQTRPTQRAGRFKVSTEITWRVFKFNRHSTIFEIIANLIIQLTNPAHSIHVHFKIFAICIVPIQNPAINFFTTCDTFRW